MKAIKNVVIQFEALLEIDVSRKMLEFSPKKIQIDKKNCNIIINDQASMKFIIFIVFCTLQLNLKSICRS